ncbi:MAG: hypothetical protein J1E59_01260 [Treponema sp.]|nr:hypothetical protein [Treponema sp.]
MNFLIAFGAFFAALSLGGGCTNLFSSNSPNNEAVTQIRAKEGYGIVTGSVPSANSASARTAMPDPDKNTPDSYRVFAQSENGLTIIEANVNQATKKFSIQLPYGTWNVTAQGLSTGKVIYSETKKVTLNAANSQVDLKFTLGYSTNPDDGIGEVSLSVSFPPPASSKITAVEYILSKGENKIVVKITEEELTAGTFKIKRIFKDLGTYTLTINFYGDFANLVYLINQKVQVYANLCTDKFVGNAAYISGGDIVLTADLLKEFENTTLYVNASTGNDSNSGTRFDPLKTFYRAVEMVNNASVEPADGFRIFLQTNVADGAFLELQSGKKLTVASADGTARTIESLERRFSVLGTSELTVKDIKFQKMSFHVAGALDMIGCEISGNTKNESGGAIYVDGGTASISDVKIFGNSVTANGGAVYVASGGKFTMSGNSTISGNTSTAGNGGGVYVGGGVTSDDTYGTFTMENGTISGNTTSLNGGGVYIYNGVFTMKDGTITENEAKGSSTLLNIGGGGIYVFRLISSSSGGIFTMQGGIVSKNTTTGDGGGILLGGYSEFLISGGTFSENTATNNGNGAYINPSCAFKMGDAAKFEKDDDIYLYSFDSWNQTPATITITSALTATGTVATITPSTYKEGREILTAGEGVTLTQEICDQFAVKPQNDDTEWIILLDNSNSGILGKTQTDLYVSESGSDTYLGTKEQPFKTMEKAIKTLKDLNDGTSEFTIYVHGHISSNGMPGYGMADFSGFKNPLHLTIQPFPGEATATLHAGGSKRVLYVPASLSGLELTLENLVLTNGAANDSSGGAAEILAGTVTMTGCEVKDSTAYYGGGAYFAKGKFTLEGCNFTGNKAEKQGGGIFVESGTLTIEGGKISENKTTGTPVSDDDLIDGGGIYVEKSALSMKGVALDKNIATRVGGAICIENGDSTAAVTLKSLNITENEAGFGGGGIFVCVEHGTFAMNGCTITTNTAGAGGGIYIDSTTFTMEGCTISENNATADGGGGVYMAAGNVTMKSSHINQNKAVADDGVGGGLATRSGATFTMESGEISGNTVKTSGGGVYLSAAKDTFNIEAGTIAKNSAQHGGGVYVANGTLNMTGGTIGGSGAANTATTYGGGVYLASTSAKFKMDDGEISYNTAGSNSGGGGGGVFIATGSFTMKDGEIKNNKGNNYGGGVYIYHGTVVNDTGSFTMEGGTISGNQAEYGGGVSSDGTVTMSGSATISSNISTGDAGGVYVAGSTFAMSGSATISSNTSARAGGGVHINRGTLTMSGNSAINGNTSTGDGGGVYVASNGAFTMSGGEISGNVSKNTGDTAGGGGVYVYRAKNGTGADAQGIFTMEGGTIKSNETADKGAGVHVSPYAMFNMSGSATVAQGNDVYLHVYDSDKIPTITVTGELTDGIHAKITPASYVAGRQVLSASGVTITQAICDKFALSDAAYKIVPGGGNYGLIQHQ